MRLPPPKERLKGLQDGLRALFKTPYPHVSKSALRAILAASEGRSVDWTKEAQDE